MLNVNANADTLFETIVDVEFNVDVDIGLGRILFFGLMIYAIDQQFTNLKYSESFWHRYLFCAFALDSGNPQKIFYQKVSVSHMHFHKRV